MQKKQNKMMLTILLAVTFLLGNVLYAAACCGPNTEPPEGDSLKGPATVGNLDVDYDDTSGMAHVYFLGKRQGQIVEIDRMVPGPSIGVNCLTSDVCPDALDSATARTLSNGEFFLVTDAGSLVIVSARKVSKFIGDTSGSLEAEVTALFAKP